MSARVLLKSPGLLVFAVAASAALLCSGAVDYPGDAGRFIGAALRGDWSSLFAHQPLMGPLSLILRVPFAAVARALGGGELWQYRAGALPCTLALAGVAAAVADQLRRRGVRDGAGVAVALLVVVNPASWQALQLGHPEELLGAALCAAAMLAALGGRPVAAGITLGLAVATKQWALVAVAPVTLAAVGPRAPLKVVLLAGGVAGGFYAIMLVGDPAEFVRLNRRAASLPAIGTANLIHAVLEPLGLVHIAPGTSTYELPRILGAALHPAVVLASVPLALWHRRSRAATHPSSWLHLLALALLVRCAFDPGDWVYYHVPMLTALAAAEAWREQPSFALPLLGVAGLWLVSVLPPAPGGAAYAVWAVALGLALGARLGGREKKFATALRFHLGMPI